MGQQPGDETPGTEDGPGETSDGAASEIEALRTELDDMRQQMLRALADAENVRRRSQKDVADARSYAITSFARDLLSVRDNFERALQSADSLDADSLPPELKGLLEGVRMTERELASVFERHGVSMIDPAGERFDPNRHQAMYEVEDTSVPAGTVVQVMQTGSLIGDRVLRPAMVAVSKGGPKPGQSAPQPDAEAQSDAAGEDAASEYRAE